MVSRSVAGRIALGGIAMALAAGAAPAIAQPQSLGDALFARPDDGRRAAAPPVARYVAETGSSFVFDRSASQRGLLRFEGSAEVWVLNAHTAPRGDVIYKNDMGEPMLRITRLGGVTLFTSEAPGGAAVALSGESAPLRLAKISPNELIQRVRTAAARAGRVAQRRIEIDVTADAESAPLVADAAMVLSDAIIRMAQHSDSRRLLAAFDAIRIGPGNKPSARIASRKVLVIEVTPAMGLAGRPSSERITRVVMESR